MKFIVSLKNITLSTTVAVVLKKVNSHVSCDCVSGIKNSKLQEDDDDDRHDFYLHHVPTNVYQLVSSLAAVCKCIIWFFVK